MAFSHQAVSALVDRLARSAYRAPRNAAVIGAGPSVRPMITPDRPGVAAQKVAMAAAIANELTTGSRVPLRLLTAPVRAKVTVAGIGPVIIVDRAENKLELFDSRRLVRTFPVATGQAIYPTPQGVFKIVQKELNPWWYPPVYDAWARGLRPVGARSRDPRHRRRHVDRILPLARLHPHARSRRGVALPARRRRHARRHRLAPRLALARQLDAEVGHEGDEPDQGEERNEEQALVAALAHRLRKGAPEQDEDAEHDPPADQESRDQDDQALPQGSRRDHDPNRSRIEQRGPRLSSRACRSAEASVSETNYTSGDDYVVEFLGYRFSFNAFDFEQRVIAAAVKLGLVEMNELDDEEASDLVALAAQGMIDGPQSRLGRYLARNWERVSLLEGESLVYWLRKLIFRGAWLDHQVKRGALEVAWDDAEAEFAYQHPGGGRPLLELAPVPSWHELQYKG